MAFSPSFTFKGFANRETFEVSREESMGRLAFQLNWLEVMGFTRDSSRLKALAILMEKS
jgi:hypothetical protein